MVQEGRMQYIQLSLMDEIQELEREVEKELRDVENLHRQTPSSIMRDVILEAAEKLSHLKEEVHQLREDTETRKKYTNTEFSSLREELDGINDENKHLHEMLVFLFNQLNRSISQTSGTTENSSIFLEEMMNSLNEGKAPKHASSRDDLLLESLKERIKFLEDHVIEQRQTIQQLIEAKCLNRSSYSPSSSFDIPANSTLTGEETIASTPSSTNILGRESSLRDLSGRFVWQNHNSVTKDKDGDVSQQQPQQQQHHEENLELDGELRNLYATWLLQYKQREEQKQQQQQPPQQQPPPPHQQQPHQGASSPQQQKPQQEPPQQQHQQQQQTQQQQPTPTPSPQPPPLSPQQQEQQPRQQQEKQQQKQQQEQHQEQELQQQQQKQQQQNILTNTYLQDAPLKEKILRDDNAPFMNKTLSQPFMQRAKLKNKKQKDPTPQNDEAFKKQRNYCVSLLRRERKISTITLMYQ